MNSPVYGPFLIRRVTLNEERFENEEPFDFRIDWHCPARGAGAGAGFEDLVQSSGPGVVSLLGHYRPRPEELAHALSPPTPLFQMAIQCAEAQTSTPAKLASPHTAAHKLGHQLLNFGTCTSLGR
jgi:hypothetical protein